MDSLQHVRAVSCRAGDLLSSAAASGQSMQPRACTQMHSVEDLDEQETPSLSSGSRHPLAVETDQPGKRKGQRVDTDLQQQVGLAPKANVVCSLPGTVCDTSHKQ